MRPSAVRLTAILCAVAPLFSACVGTGTGTALAGIYEPGVDNVLGFCAAPLNPDCFYNYDFYSVNGGQPPDPAASNSNAPLTMVFTSGAGAVINTVETKMQANVTSYYTFCSATSSTDYAFAWDKNFGQVNGGFDSQSGDEKTSACQGSPYFTCPTNDFGDSEACDYHIKLYGPYDSMTYGYFVLGDAHEDRNEGNSGQKYFGWYEDTSTYIGKRFQAQSYHVDFGTQSWQNFQNPLRTVPGEKNCTSQYSGGTTGHFWYDTGNGAYYCKQSDGYAIQVSM